jgi:hypothetical protein
MSGTQVGPETPTLGQLPSPPSASGIPLSADHASTLASQSSAHYSALAKADKMASVARKQLDKLSGMGDSVSPEDVIDSAGKMVASGIDPMQMAGVLADMPEGSGEALAGWVAQHAKAAEVKYAQLQQALAASRHAMGVAALHDLVGHQLPGRPQAASPPNPLMPGNGAPSNPLMTGSAPNA